MSEWNSARTPTGGWWINSTTPVYFRQVADIDASETRIWDHGRGLRPIGYNETATLNRFYGIYDGQGHSISNLYINTQSEGMYPAGLFSSIQGTASNPTIIRDVHLVDVQIFGNSVAGGIVGEMSINSLVQNCSVQGTIVGFGTVGGIAGIVRNASTIEKCWTAGTIIGNTAAGIAGTLNTSIVQNSYTLAQVSGGYNGGIAGLTINARIANCYSIGDNSDFGTDGNGGSIAGYAIPGETYYIKNNLWNTDLNIPAGFGYINPANPNNNLGKTTDEMKQQSTYPTGPDGWDFVYTWGLSADINDGYPYLRGVSRNAFDGDNNSITPLTLTKLQSNYPNPFNPSTTINFNLGVASIVSIDIFNIKGQKVKALLNENFEVGPHSVVWNGDDSNGRQVGSGVYFYRMKTEGYVSTKKMLLLK
jgi:hypothetical protein